MIASDTSFIMYQRSFSLSNKKHDLGINFLTKTWTELETEILNKKWKHA